MPIRQSWDGWFPKLYEEIMQGSYGERSGLEEKLRGNRRWKWRKRKERRDGKRKGNESEQKRKNRPSHVRVTNAVGQQMNAAQ